MFVYDVFVDVLCVLIVCVFFFSFFRMLFLWGGFDLDDRYSNLFLNAYINRHAHTEYLKMI